MTVRARSLDDEGLKGELRAREQAGGAAWRAVLDLLEHLASQLFADDLGALLRPDALVLVRRDGGGDEGGAGSVRVHPAQGGSLRVVHVEAATGREHERTCAPAELERVVRARLIRLRLESELGA